jgi:hypothetical protein
MKTCGAHSTPFVRRSSTLGVNLQAQGQKQPPTTTAESSTLVSIDEENACESVLAPEGDYVSGADLEESRMLEGTSFGRGDGWEFGSPPLCKKETSALSLLSASAVVLRAAAQASATLERRAGESSHSSPGAPGCSGMEVDSEGGGGGGGGGDGAAAVVVVMTAVAATSMWWQTQGTDL